MYDINNVFTYAYSAGTDADLAQTFTSDVASTNVIDLDSANIKLGAGKPMWLHVVAIAAFNTLTSLEVLLQTDTNSGFGTNLLEVMMWRVLLADIDAAGDIIVNQTLPHFRYQRWMRLYFNVIGSANSVGSIFGALSDVPLEPPLQLDMVDSGA